MSESVNDEDQDLSYMNPDIEIAVVNKFTQ